MRCILALLFGTALLPAADPGSPAAAFYWDATSVAVSVGKASEQAPQNPTKLPGPKLRPPFGDMFAMPHVSNLNGLKIGDHFDINLTGNFCVRATVSRFIYNKTEYQQWIVVIAAVDPGNRQQYAAAIQTVCTFSWRSLQGRKEHRILGTSETP